MHINLIQKEKKKHLLCLAKFIYIYIKYSLLYLFWFLSCCPWDSCIFLEFSESAPSCDLWYNCWYKTKKAGDFWKIVHFFLPHYFFVPEKRSYISILEVEALSSAEVSDHSQWMVTMKGGGIPSRSYACMFPEIQMLLIPKQNHQQ